ncbi:MAG: sugar kinase [Acidobacteria bacterium]|nr:sugar kinase [Acidobacteriota bacterium]
MSLLVVGSVAFDSIQSPYGRIENALGGAATYFSVSASWFVPVRMLAVVGEDFGAKEMDVFTRRGIDTDGLEHVAGKTFRWAGEYSGTMNEAKTLDTQLNVFETFAPRVPPSYQSSEFVFLANIHPALQLHVRQQLPGARAVGLDSMNLWIRETPEDLKKALAVVDILIINEAEARMLSGDMNLRRAAAVLRRMGPRIVVLKRGEYGASLFTEGSSFSAPGLPLEIVKDPTGAGDTFAGGFMGHLAKVGDLSESHLRRAVIYGSVMASFAVEDFGLARLLKLDASQIAARYREFQNLTQFDAG